MAFFNTFKFNTRKFNESRASFYTEMFRLADTKPKIKIEFETIAGVATDISAYYESGGAVERIKERAPDEIQAGDFDIVLFNHDDYFSEYKASSLFYGIQYHGAKIKIWAGFQLPDGRTEYKIQQVGYIDTLEAHSDTSKVTLRCRDFIRRLVDAKLHNWPTAAFPTAGATNGGNGVCSAVNTKPFKTQDETWTITCTTPGGDGVAQFSVVGSISGSVGTATSGTEFSTGDGTGGIKLTVTGGTDDYEAGDTFTFQTRQYPEWDGINPGKIIWSILTGYNWDTNTQEAWADFVLDFDHTQASTNTDLDYDAFSDVIGRFDAADLLTGYIDYGESATDFLRGILLMYLGSLFTGGDGRIRIETYEPVFEASPVTFADTQKILSLGYVRAVDELINVARVRYKATKTWEFSDESIMYDGKYSARDSASITKYAMEYVFEYDLKWYSATAVHAQDFANRIIMKYSEPPLVIDFETGSDGLLAEVGDKIEITDEKYGFDALGCEVSRVTKQLDGKPVSVGMTARREGDLDLLWGFLGSRVDEGDGLSPQADTYGAATDSDKRFCYLTDGYRMY